MSAPLDIYAALAIPIWSLALHPHHHACLWDRCCGIPLNTALLPQTHYPLWRRAYPSALACCLF